jgi:hypothetical protein
MKKQFILFLSLFIFATCDENKYVDVTVMPDETTVGAETFGCVKDGWLYVGGRYFEWMLFWGHSSIECNYLKSREELSLSIEVKRGLFIRFIIDNPETGKESPITKVFFGGEELPDGTATITRFDLEHRIISGRFEDGRITHGRFDIKFGIRE